MENTKSIQEQLEEAEWLLTWAVDEDFIDYWTAKVEALEKRLASSHIYRIERRCPDRMEALDIFDENQKTNKRRWKNKVKVFKRVSLDDVEKTLNDFYDRGQFITGTQLFPMNSKNYTNFDVVVYFRVPQDQ